MLVKFISTLIGWMFLQIFKVPPELLYVPEQIHLAYTGTHRKVLHTPTYKLQCILFRKGPLICNVASYKKTGTPQFGAPIVVNNITSLGI